MRILSNITYRFEVFAAIFTNIIILVASVFLWQTAYNGISQVESFTLKEIVTYTVLSILLGSVYITDVQNTIYYRIREGKIVTDFFRPIPLLTSYLADDIGSSISALVNRVLPLFLFASLVFGPPLPATWVSFLLFIPSCILGYAILWLLSALVGLTAFWVMELGNLGMVKDSIVRVLSGSIVPLWFFPDGIQKVSAYLPFQYTYQAPLSIYIGAASSNKALVGMGIQCIWIILLTLLLAAAWKRTKSKTLIQGG
ncbi:hypothetical protein SY83_20850 [Paenibacillus swuensis]|uniref:ABC transporter permease n=1 Tax=Paenibacillus swuensis TaxID=1178515 RepID=A0A172TN60_9BACL|nr:ABC-2 family transporter protein [Paenibacillus swuensis]ANE48324.1 hypothetical protein SY83_20850 [Paenibacillus swuensis]